MEANVPVLAKDVRQTVVLEIIRLVQSGKKLKEALEELGIPEPTYHRWKVQNAAIITQFLAKQQETLQIQLADIAIARQSVIAQLVDLANGGTLDLSGLLAIESRLSELQQATAHVLGTEDKQQDGAAAFLDGVHLKKGINRVTKTTVTEEIHFDDDPPPTIIDASVIEEPPKN
jgi:hypothetical protein